MTSELEISMIIYFAFQSLITKYRHQNKSISETGFTHVRSSCISTPRLKMLPFYLNISIETLFLTTEQYTKLLTFYHEI